MFDLVNLESKLDMHGEKHVIELVVCYFMDI